MAKVQTVLGPIDSADLGTVLMHEHVVEGWGGWQYDSSLSIDWDAVKNLVVGKLKEAKAAGVSTIVDASTLGMGADPNFLADVSEQSEVNIIVVSGVFAWGVPDHFRGLNPEQLAKVYIAEATKGICGTTVRSGIIKGASRSTSLTKSGERNLKAAAIAARETGLPLITHTDRGSCGDEQARIFLEAGVNPAKIVIGHSCGNGDLRYHRRLFEMGVYVGFDRIGLEGPPYNTDEVRAACLIAHLNSGFASQITMSQDQEAFWCGPSLNLGRVDGTWLHLFRNFIPRLRERGVPSEAIEQIMVKNPRRIFEA